MILGLQCILAEFLASPLVDFPIKFATDQDKCRSAYLQKKKKRSSFREAANFPRFSGDHQNKKKVPRFGSRQIFVFWTELQLY